MRFRLNTKFAQLRVYDSTKTVDVTFDRCTVDALMLTDKHRQSWDPAEIRNQLEQLGITFLEPEAPTSGPVPTEQVDAQIRDVEKVVRYFLRSTHMSESVMKLKLGGRGQAFIDQTLPRLRKCGVIVEIENRGAGTSVDSDLAFHSRG